MNKVFKIVLTSTMIGIASVSTAHTSVFAKVPTEYYFGEHKGELLYKLRDHSLVVDGVKFGMNLMEASKLQGMRPISSRYQSYENGSDYDAVTNQNLSVYGFADFQEDVPVEKRVINRIYIASNHRDLNDLIYVAPAGYIGMSPTVELDPKLYIGDKSIANVYPKLTMISSGERTIGFYMTDYNYNSKDLVYWQKRLAKSGHVVNTIYKYEWTDDIGAQSKLKKVKTDLPYKTIEKKSSEYPVGTRIIETKGENGYMIDVYSNYDGDNTGFHLEDNESIKYPVDEVILVGSKPKITTKIIKETKVLKYKTTTKKDSSKYTDYKKIIKKGKNGSVKISTKVTYENGKKVKSEVISKKTIKAINQVQVVGTKKKNTNTSIKNDVVTSGLNFNSKFVDGRYEKRTSDPKQGYQVGKSTWSSDGLKVGYIKINEKQPIDTLLKSSETIRYQNAKSESYRNKVVFERPDVNLSTPVNLTFYNHERFNKNQLFDLEKFNNELIKLINKDRSKLGVTPITYNARIQKGTEGRAIELANINSTKVNNKAHVRPDGRAYFTIYSDDLQQEVRGENTLEYAYDGNPYTLISEKYLAEKVYKQFYNDPPHRAIMMDAKNKSVANSVKITEYTINGIKSQNAIFAVQNFSSKK